jgi:hypothetical protein
MAFCDVLRLPALPNVRQFCVTFPSRPHGACGAVAVGMPFLRHGERAYPLRHTERAEGNPTASRQACDLQGGDSLRAHLFQPAGNAGAAQKRIPRSHQLIQVVLPIAFYRQGSARPA